MDMKQRFAVFMYAEITADDVHVAATACVGACRVCQSFFELRGVMVNGEKVMGEIEIIPMDS
jgi:uncharacterized protein YuzB (UPF0349 family)